MSSYFKWMSLGVLALIAVLPTQADDEVEWVQVHADVEYVRTGTSATQKAGKFSYVLTASLDQLMVLVKPNEGETWPDYVLLDDYPLTGKISGKITLSADAHYGDVAAEASVGGPLTSLDQLKVESIKAMPSIFPGIGAEIRVNAHHPGNATSNLPHFGNPTGEAIFIWPVPLKYDEETSDFLSEGFLHAYPNFGPRPAGKSESMVYDLMVGSTDASIPGLGGITAPSVGAVLTGTPDNWTLSFSREATPELTSGGEYSHAVKITIRLVPRTLAIPAPLPETR